MAVSRQDITVIIVSYKSQKVIYDCLRSIPSDIKVVIVENSNDKILKENIENKFDNVNCILSNINLGMGGGNNLGIKHVDTDLALILNPDVILEKDAISNLLESANQLSSFAIISPISDNKKYPNYKIDKNQIIGNLNPFKVFSVDGYAMTLNLKKLNSIKNFYYFDENIFMYLENDDLCKRIRDLNEDIYINPSSKVNHLGGKAVDSIYEYQIEMSRNWHWIWSKFYFNKKHYGLLSSLKDGIPTFLSALVKYLLFFFFSKRKKDIYFHRMYGFISALIGKSSFYRPKINL